MSNGHAELSPSGMGRIVQCPGSKKMQSFFPKSEHPSADEGQIAHKVAAAIMNGVPIDGPVEMLEGADMWLDALSGYSPINIELPVYLNELIWGTPDAWSWFGDTLMVADYKFGHGLVDVVKNWQLITYAAAIIQHRQEKPEKIDFIIVQPRGFHPQGAVRKWSISYNEFCGYRQKVLDRAEEAMNDKAACYVGKECLHCTARHSCPTLLASDYNILELVQETQPFFLSHNAIGKELELMESAMLLVKARITGLQEEVIARMRKGFSVSGWTMKASYGHEDWAKPLNEVIALGQMMGIDISSPGALTPKQAIKKGIPAEIVRMYSETKQSGVKLVKEAYNGEFN